MSCQIKMVDGKKTYLTPEGTESKLYNKISSLTSNSHEADQIFKHAYSKKDIDLNTQGEPVVTNDRFSDGSSLYPRKVLSDYSTVNKLFNKIDGVRVSEHSKKVDSNSENLKAIKETFNVSGESNGKVYVTKPGPTTIKSEFKKETSPSYGTAMDKVSNFFHSVGVSVQHMDSYLTNVGYRNSGLQGVVGLADTANRIIALSDKGNNAQTLTEEAGHMAVDFFTNQDMVDKALANIDKTELYKEHAEHYRGKYSRFGLTQEEIDTKVRREIFGKYVGQAINNNTYPKGFRGVINAIIAKIKEMFNPTHKNIANQIAKFVNKADKNAFNNVPTGDVFFDSSDTLLDRMLVKITQYQDALLKRKNKKTAAGQVTSMLTAINNANKDQTAEDPGFIAFIETLATQTKEALEKLENQDSLTAEQVNDLDTFFAYYKPYVTQIKGMLAPNHPLHKPIEELNTLFFTMESMRDRFSIDTALNSLEGVSKEDVDALKKEFSQISVDSSLLNRWFMSGADSANPIARILSYMITTLFKKVNMEVMDFSREFLDNAERLGITNTDFLYHKKGKNATGYFVRPTDQEFKYLTSKQQEFATIVENTMTSMYRDVGKKYKGLAPQMTASTLDIAMRSNDSTIGSLFAAAKDSIKANTNDDIGFIKAVGSRPDGSSERLVPVYYTARLEDPSMITNDAIKSIMAFKKMSENNKQMKKSSFVFENILGAFGRSELSKDGNLKKGTATNDFAKMRTMLDMFVYGETKSELKEINGYSLTKIVDKFKSYVTQNNLAGSFFTQAAGYISAKTFAKLDSYLQEHSSSKSQKFAAKTLPKLYLEAVGEIGNKRKKAKLNVLLQDLGIYGSTEQIFDNLNKNKFTRLIADNPTMAGFELGAYSVKSSVTLAALDHYRLYKNEIIKPGNANYENATPLHELLLNGKKIGSTRAKHQANMAFMGALIGNQVAVFEGGMNPTDKTAAQQNAWASLLLTHKSWIIKGFSKRFRSKSFNYELDKKDVGYWRSTAAFFASSWNQENINMIKYMIEAYPELPAEDQVAVKKFLIEFTMTFAMIAAASIFNNLFEDEEEGIAPYTLYLFNRVFLELTALSPTHVGLVETTEILKNPLVATGQVQNMLDTLKIWDSDEIESGNYKGWKKNQRAFMKMIPGVKGIMASKDPKYANRWLKQGPLKYSLWSTDDD